MSSSTRKGGSTGRASLEELGRLVMRVAGGIWSTLSSDGSQQSPGLEFSGFLALNDPLLQPFLDQSGVFLVLGPEPELPILHVGASQGPVRRALYSRIAFRQEEGFVWRWGPSSAPPPTHAGCITLPSGGGAVWVMRNHIEARLSTSTPGA